MAESRTIGFWVPSNPVKTGRSDVLATSYVRGGRAMIALASWATASVEVRLALDWKALGLDPAKARITAPEIAGFQEGQTFDAAGPIPVEPGKGWLLILQ
jgi:hypothetical protein